MIATLDDGTESNPEHPANTHLRAGGYVFDGAQLYRPGVDDDRPFWDHEDLIYLREGDLCS